MKTNRASSFLTCKDHLLQESMMLTERIKKLRALNANPKEVGMDPHMFMVNRLSAPNYSWVCKIEAGKKVIECA